MTEAALRLTLVFARAHDTAIRVWGPGYGQTIRPYRDQVRAAMARFGCSAIEAPRQLMEEARAGGEPLREMVVIALMAAALDEVQGGDHGSAA